MRNVQIKSTDIFDEWIFEEIIDWIQRNLGNEISFNRKLDGIPLQCVSIRPSLMLYALYPSERENKSLDWYDRYVPIPPILTDKTVVFFQNFQ